MATKYCDHGLYGAYSAAPTWGQAQDGDGTGIGAATPSTAEIVFTGVPSSGSIFILGVAVAPTWATSADNCANLLATAINALTTTAVGPASFTTKSQVRNHVYARGPANGAPAGTCQIMTRQGSASHAGLVAFTHTLNNVSSAATVNFSGGTGGAWGWLFNPSATIWASAVAIGGYGLLAAALPYTGSLSNGDVVKVRSNKTITLNASTSTTWVMSTMGSAASPVRFDIDDGTVWPADGSTPVLTVAQVVTNNNGMNWQHSTTTFAHINCKQYASGQRNLVLQSSGNGPTTPTIVVQVGCGVRFDNIDLVCPGTPTASPGPQASASAQFATVNSRLSTSGAYGIVKNARIVQPGQAPGTSSSGPFVQGQNMSARVEFIECEVVLTAPQTAWNYAVSFFFGGSPNRLTFDSCKFTGFVSGSRLVSTGLSISSAEQAAIFKNCDLGGITLLGPNFLGNAAGELDAGTRGLFISSQYGNREFVIDRPGRMYSEWVAAKGRPTLNGKLHDGTTPWSIFAVPSTTAANIGKLSPVDMPRIGKAIPANADLTEGVRTLTLNFLLESNLSWTKQDISILLDYQQADGSPRTVDTYDPDAGALTTTTEAWSATSWNGQTWLKRAFSVTTPTAVKAGTEIGIYVRFHTSVSNDTYGVIIDPEVIVA